MTDICNTTECQLTVVEDSNVDLTVINLKDTPIVG